MRHLHCETLSACILLLSVVAGVSQSNAQTGPPYTISTVAGGGPNNLPALSATINLSYGIARDSMGNIFTSDYASHRVFKIDASGILTVFAGNGIYGNSGDGGPATKALLFYPYGVAVDGSGNVFIADGGACVIREVTATTGTISTVAGNGTCGYSGDGGSAIQAKLNGPIHVFVDAAGGIFIGDTYNNVVRKVTAGTGIISTVVGNGTAGYTGNGGLATQAELNFTTGVYVDSAGDIFVTDTNNNVVRKVTAGTGIISTVVGNGTAGYTGDNGPATQAQLDQPYGIALDAAGNLFIADKNNCVIREVNTTTQIISTVAGKGVCGYTGDGGAATQAEFFLPFDVTVDAAGDLFIADSLNYVIRKVAATIVSTVAGNGEYLRGGDGGPATQAELFYPEGVTVDGSGNLYIADSDNYVIRQVTAGTRIISTVAGNGTLGYTGDGGPATKAQLGLPPSVSMDVSGNYYFSDVTHQVIRKVTAGTTIISTAAGNGTQGYAGDGGPATQAQLNGPYGIASDAAGDLFIADTFNNVVRKVTATTGIISTVAGNGKAGSSGDGGPATQAELNQPYGAAVDGAGDLFIADRNNNVIRKVAAGTGIISTVAGNASGGFGGDGGPATQAHLSLPEGVFVDSLGNIFIADSFNNAIREVNAATGIISTIAGNRTPGYAGDGGPAANAEMDLPTELAVDPSGHVFVADNQSLRIRELTPTVCQITHTLTGLALNATVSCTGDFVQGNVNQAMGFQWGDNTQTGSGSGGGSNCGVTPGSCSFSTSHNYSSGGTYAVTPTGTDASGTGLTIAGFNVTVSAPSITTTSLPAAVSGTMYNQVLLATGGTTPYTWSVVSGGLPPGLGLTGATISGTPTTGGTFNFTVAVTDANGLTVTQGLSILVVSSLTVTTTTLYVGTVGVGYSQTLQVAGGTSPYTWSTASGSLPPGLSLGVSGVISGMPSATGTFSFTVKVSDANGIIATSGSLSILIESLLSVTTTSLPTGVTGTAYSQTFQATGGATPYTWSIPSGSLPLGMGLSGATISGTPTTAGTYNFTVKVTDANGISAAGGLSLLVVSQLAITTTALPAGRVGIQYNQTLQATGGTTPYSWSVTSGSLPTGLSFNAGVISGTPPAAGVSNFNVKVTDAGGLTAGQGLSIAIESPLSVTTMTLSGGTIGGAYSQTLQAAGGTTPYTWSLVSGLLPPGLGLTVPGVITGKPTAAGTFIFLASVTDSSGFNAQSGSLTIAVAAPPSAPSCPLPNVANNDPNPLIVTVTSKCIDSQSSITSTTIDWGDGMTAASGTSASHTYAAGSYSITVTATNSAGLSNTVSVNVTVTAPIPTSVPQGQPAQGSANPTAPLGVPTATVTYQCTSATGPSGPQQLTFYHLACNINSQGATATVTLSGTPTPVNISVQTNSSVMALMRKGADVKDRPEPMYAAFWLLPGLVIVTGACSKGRIGRSRKTRAHYAILLLMGFMICGLWSCGGGGSPPPPPPPPPQNVTPTGTYTVTGTGTSSGGSTSTITVGFTVTIGG